MIELTGESVPRELGDEGGRVVPAGPRGRLPPRRRRRRGQPQQEPRLVDAEQLGVPERAAAGGAGQQGAELHPAVPRRPDRHRQRLRDTRITQDAKPRRPVYSVATYNSCYCGFHLLLY